MYTRETGVGVFFLHLEELDDNTSLFRLEFFFFFLLCPLLSCSIFPFFFFFFSLSFPNWFQHGGLELRLGLVGVFNRRRWHLDPSGLVWTGG